MFRFFSKIKTLFKNKNKIQELDERLIKIEKSHMVMVKHILKVVSEIEKSTNMTSINNSNKKDEYSANILSEVNGRNEEPTYH